MLPKEVRDSFSRMIEAAEKRELESSKEASKNVVTTKELAGILGVDRTTVIRTVRRLEKGGAVLHSYTFDKYNNATWVFNEEQATIIKKEIQRHHNLSSRKIDSVSTEVEENEIIASAIVILKRRNKELKERLCLAEMSLDMFTKSNDLLIIRDVAKILDFKNIGEKKLFAILREMKILGKDNMPYQKYVDMGYFKVTENTYVDADGNNRISKTTKVTQNGVVYLKKVLTRVIN